MPAKQKIHLQQPRMELDVVCVLQKPRCLCNLIAITDTRCLWWCLQTNQSHHGQGQFYDNNRAHSSQPQPMVCLGNCWIIQVRLVSTADTLTAEFAAVCVWFRVCRAHYRTAEQYKHIYMHATKFRKSIQLCRKEIWCFVSESTDKELHKEQSSLWSKHLWPDQSL